MIAKEILIAFIILIIPAFIFAFDCGYRGYEGCSIAEIKQIGFYNKGNIETLGFNRSTIYQEGLKNEGKINQNWAFWGNKAEILQHGNYNSASQHQMGINNYTSAEQIGLFNSIVQDQKGTGNISISKQFGISNEALQLQQSSFNLANVIQMGFYNKTIQIQGIKGIGGNTSNIIQTGIGKITIIFQ